MIDERKTKKQLIQELGELRRECTQLNEAETNWKQAEAALQESEKRLRVLSSATFEGIVFTDRGQFIDANQQFADMMGYEISEILGLEVKQFVHPDDIELVQSNILSGKEDPYVHRGIRKDGSTITVEVHPRMMSISGKQLRVTIIHDITERVQAEQVLRQSEANLAKAQQIAHIGNWNWDIVANTISWSDELYRIVGLSPQEFAANYEAYLKCIHPDDLELFRTTTGRILEEKKPYDIEYRIVRPNNDIRVVREQGEVTVDTNGKPVNLFGTAQDITERVRSEEALRVSEERFALAVQGSNAGIWDWDILNNSLYWSPRMKELLGYADDELEVDFDTFESYLHPDDREHTAAAIESHLKDRRLYDVEQRLRTKSGEYHWFNARGQALWDEAGKPLRMLGSTTDITEQVRAEQALRKQREELQLIFDTMPAAIWFKDKYNKILRVNKAAAETMGMPVEDIEGRPAEELFPEDAEHYYEDDLEVMNSGEPKLGIIEQLQVPSGERRWVSTDKAPYYNERGNLAGVVAFVVDITEQMQTEQTLRESEEKYRTLFERESDGIFIYDPDTTNILDANETTSKIYGYDKDELIGMSCLKFSAEVEESASSIDRISETGEVNVPIRYHQKKDGKVFPVDVSGYAITLGGKNVMFAVSKDITQRVQAEEALRESEKRLKEAQAMGQIGSWEYDIENQKIMWSDQVYVLYERDPALGPPTAEEEAAYYSPEQDQILKEYARRVIEEGKEFAYDLRARMPSGKQTHFTATMRPIKDKSGRTAKIIGTVQDITERVRAEEALRESEERYRSMTEDVIDTSAIGIFILDNDFQVVWVNKALEQFFGTRRDKVIGQDKRQLINRRIKYIFEDPEGFEQKVLATYDNNVYVEKFECHVLPDGERQERWLEHWSQPIRSGLYAGGRIEHYSDITERKQADEQIQAALAEKTVLLQEVHHRVKNNLQVIISLLNLQAEHVRDEQTLDILRQSQSRVFSMALVHDELYRSPSLAQVDFARYVNGLASQLFSLNKVSPGYISLQLDVQEAMLGIDQAIPCGLIVNELLSNSLKYAFPRERSGTVRLSLRQERDHEEVAHYLLVVSDDGVGLPEELDPGNSDTLGLHLVYNLVKQLNGRLELDRTSGTTFKITFPQIVPEGS